MMPYNSKRNLVKVNRLRHYVITTLLGGFLVILPIAILFIVVRFLFNLVNRLLTPISVVFGLEGTSLPPLLVDLLSLIIVLVFCFLMGVMVKTKVGNSIYGYVEDSYLRRLPLYGTIKETVQQFSGVKKMPFSEVILVDVFGTGSYMTGFVTDDHASGNLTIFVPTAPNPLNGFVFHVKEEQVVRLPATNSEEAMKTIIAMGVGSNKAFVF